MAYSKIILNGDTLMDVTGDTVDAGNLLSGETATKNSGAKVTGNIVSKSSSDLTASGATVTAPAGYYSSNASKSVATGTATAPTSISGTSATVSTGTNTLTLSKTVSNTPRITTVGYISSGTAGDSSVSLTASVYTRSSSDLTASGATVTAPAGYYASSASKAVASGTEGTPTATKGTVSNHSVSVTPKVTNTAGYITGSTKTGTAVTVLASELVSGTYTVDSSGTKDVTNYASASIGALTLPSALTNSASGTSIATLNLPNGVNKYLQIPKGYNNTNSYYQLEVPTGTAGTPTATKGTVSNHAVNVTPSVTNTTGYITGSTKTGTAATVSASELVSGTKSITENGTGIDVTNYASVNVNVSGGTPTLITKNITANGTYTASSDNADGYSSVTVNVSGGASNVIAGTFTTNSTGGNQTISVPYSGNGFIIALFIFLSEGAYNTSGTAYSTLHQYGMACFNVIKCDRTTPNYSAGTNDKAMVLTRHKNSTTSSTSMTSGNTNSASVYDSINVAGYSSASQTLRIQSPTSLSIYVSGASSTYGFLPSTEYTYSVVYSS